MNWRYKRFVTAMILILLILAVVFGHVPGKEEEGKKLSKEITSEVKDKEVKSKAVKEGRDAPADQCEVEVTSEEPSKDEPEESQENEDSLEEMNSGKDTVTKEMSEPPQATEVPAEDNELSKEEEADSNDEMSEDKVKVRSEDAEIEDSVPAHKEKEKEQTVTIQVPIYEEETVYWIKDDLGSIIYKSTDPKEWEAKILYYAENAVKTTYGQNGVEIVSGHKAPDTIPITVWENSGWYGNEDVIVTYN